MNVAIIGIVGLPACYGGFETLVDNIIEHIAQYANCTVFCSAKYYTVREESYKGSHLRYLRINANGISSIFYDFVAMLLSLRSDAMLILGVSGCLFLPIIRMLFKGKIITNIDGIEWKRQKWGVCAKALLQFSEKMAVKYSDIIIGDNEGIIDYVKSKYAIEAALIEYGSDNAKIVNNDSFFNDYPLCRGRYAISVCRIEPENNIHVILEAFSKSPWIQLIVVGNWEKSKYAKNLWSQYSSLPNIHLYNPIYDSEKINWLRSNASIYIHGHSAGGTNPSLVEAMNLSLPILAFDCSYNRFTTEEKCLYWSNEKELAELLCEVDDDIVFESMANNMKEIAARRYQWNQIAMKYFDCLR